MWLLSADQTHYLANQPDGIVLAYLIVAGVLFFLSITVALRDNDVWRALASAGLFALTLALLKPF